MSCGSGPRASGKHPPAAAATAGTGGTPAPLSTVSPGTSIGAALAGAVLRDLTWVSTTEGWALAAQPCSTGLCARVAHTTDGGAHWQALPDPPAQLAGYADCSQVACVSGVRFASPTVGYLYGPALLMTIDGGQSWHAEPGLQVETLTVADGNVYRVAYDHTGCPGPCQPTLQSAPVGAGSWRTLVGQLAYPDRSGSAQIVNSSSTLLVAMYGSEAGPVSAQAVIYRSTDDGVSWQQGSDPCSGSGAVGTSAEEDLIDLAAAPGGFFAGLCSAHTGTGNLIVRSIDGGGDWQVATATPAGQGVLTAASPSTLAIATGATGGSGAFTAELLVSNDAGQHWATVATDTQQLAPPGFPAWLGFESSDVGRWVGDARSVWTTQDGGRDWIQGTFP